MKQLFNMFKLESKASVVRLACVIAAVAILFTLPAWGSKYAIMMVTLMGIYITLGHMWNLLAGYSGLVSLGQQMYIGVGAFTLAVFSNNFGVPLIIGLLLGGLVSVVISVGLSYLLLRMKGMYFAIASWMFAEAMVLVIVNLPSLGKGQGLFIVAARALTDAQKYYFSVVLLLVVTLVMVILLRSKTGLGLFAIRDNDTGAQTSGVPLFRSKLICMIIASFVTGVAGGIYYITMIWIQPYTAFSISWTVAAVFIVVIGGIGTITGPIVGGVIYVVLSQYLSTLSQLGSLNMVILGVIAVAVILAAPKGIVGTLQSRFGFEIISARRWMKKYVDRLPEPLV
ncbi:MAG: branched-chain amino acid ABC transporter permease [Clostridiales Family XIII bacterium]|jgi:branched-chain amino acid transport system permease protein|nr:branched-chain amino acid ABC transporter permease [Clostridiales Family XIII bacterium]